MKPKIASSFALLAFLPLFASSNAGHAQELDDGTTFEERAIRALEPQHEVYWVAYWHSDTPPSTNRSASIITTGNTSQTETCEVTVDWFNAAGG
jgi:hypothetical protein